MHCTLIIETARAVCELDIGSESVCEGFAVILCLRAALKHYHNDVMTLIATKSGTGLDTELVCFAVVRFILAHSLSLSQSWQLIW